jgi:glc operon protein GlcG
MSKPAPPAAKVYHVPMLRLLSLVPGFLAVAVAAVLPTRKYLNPAAIKTMAAAAEWEVQNRNVQVTICIVDESANLLFLQKAGTAGRLKGGDVSVLAFPDAFPNQGGVPILVDGQTIGAIACSGAPSEVDEAIAQAAIDALLKK